MSIGRYSLARGLSRDVRISAGQHHRCRHAVRWRPPWLTKQSPARVFAVCRPWCCSCSQFAGRVVRGQARPDQSKTRPSFERGRLLSEVDS
jgi:hypothetical protein